VTNRSGQRALHTGGRKLLGKAIGPRVKTYRRSKTECGSVGSGPHDAISGVVLVSCYDTDESPL
jgi:hypothetical protein